MSQLIVGPFNRVEGDLEVRLDTVERTNDQLAHRGFGLWMVGGTVTWSETALRRRRSGVAALLSDASATNQARGMSVGRPIGMPAIFGVRWSTASWSYTTSPRSTSAMPRSALPGCYTGIIRNSA